MAHAGGTVRVRMHTAVAAMAFALSGCARHGPLLDPLAAPAPEPVVLEVSNHNWHDMAIYVVSNGQRIRVMTVVAANDASMVIPRGMLGHMWDVRLQAYAIGGKTRYTSDRVYTRPGSTVTWTLEADLRKSSLAVW